VAQPSDYYIKTAKFVIPTNLILVPNLVFWIRCLFLGCVNQVCYRSANQIPIKFMSANQTPIKYVTCGRGSSCSLFNLLWITIVIALTYLRIYDAVSINPISFRLLINSYVPTFSSLLILLSFLFLEIEQADRIKSILKPAQLHIL
jgi:hypothetical protein